jgi:hypothetical protein
VCACACVRARAGNGVRPGRRGWGGDGRETGGRRRRKGDESKRKKYERTPLVRVPEDIPGTPLVAHVRVCACARVRVCACGGHNMPNSGIVLRLRAPEEDRIEKTVDGE